MSFPRIRRKRENQGVSPIIFAAEQFSGYQIESSPFGKQLEISTKPSLKASTKPIKGPVFAKGRSVSLRKRKQSLEETQGEDEQLLLLNYLHFNLKEMAPRNIYLAGDRKKPAVSTERNSAYRSNNIATPILNTVGLNQYSLEFVIGKGGFGKVWKVQEKGSGKYYAMKEMQKVKIIAKRSVNSVMNEKHLLTNLRSPYLVNILCSFQTRENIYLVLDYCNRGDLRYHLGNRGTFNENQAQFYTACILLSLEYLHNKQIIHRDLKPQNLVIDDKGYLRITDLGVSRQVKANNAEDTSGTPGYMAPEVICKMNHSFPVDFFALGVIVYEMITGRRPYVGVDRKEIKEKILAKQVQLDANPPFGWSKESVDFVNKMIKRRAEDRLGTQGIVEIKKHPWLKKIDWEKIADRKFIPPFLPPVTTYLTKTIEKDYINYRQCISQDTEIADVEEYNMILRHKDTQEAFKGYEFFEGNSRQKSISKFQFLTHTTMDLRKRPV